MISYRLYGRDRDDGDGDVRYHDDGDDSRDCDNDGGNHDDAYSAGEAEADSAYMSRSTASTNTKGDSFSDDSGCVFIKEISSTSHQPHSEDRAPPPGVVGSSSSGTITVKSVTQNDSVTGKRETTKGSDGVAAVSRGDKRPPMAISQYNQTLMSKSQLLLQQQQMQKRMDDKKRLFHCAGKGLPDGGKKLLDDIDELQRGISAIALRVPHALESVPTAAGKVSSKVETANMVAQQSGNSLQPLILTHAVPLPPHVFQQMYGDNPQLNTLYDGGRMNAARRREVAAVTADAIEKLHRSIQTCPAETDELEDPAGLKVRLMVHQRQALSWLTWREKQQPPSGILADDMGLGKTLTMISLVLKQKQAKVEDEEAATAEWFDKTKAKGLVRSGGTLIIAPASLVHQWHKEIERHCNRGLLKVLLYHGPNREKSVRMIASHDVVLTTYTIVGREVGRGQQESADDPAQDEPDAAAATGSSSTQPTLLRVAWERIVLDEGHSIKNHKSLSAMAACRLRAAHRWVVTGTPIQNNLLDMYALLRFLRCSPFDEYKVWKRWVDNKSAQSTKRLSTLVKALLLRRTKDQKGTCGEPLVSLPTRTAILHKVTLNKDEKAIYDQVFSKSKQTMENYLKKHEEAAENRDASSHGGVRPPNPFVSASQLYSQTSGGSTTAVPDNKTSGTYILVLLLRLRQCCNHLSLLKDGIDTETSENEGIEMDVAEHMKDLHIDGVAAPPDAPAGGATASSSRAALFLPRYVSTKVAAVLTQLADIKQQSPPGQPAKSVIVSQWTSMLRVMKEHLEQHGYRTCSIQGNVPPRKRADLVESFNTDPRGPEIMLLSLKAGGVGLNLIGGNNLFMMDMHWNPALESQACDRVYRVGQLKDVTIHKFVCAGTVEEKIQKLQQRKMSLANDVLTGGKIQSQKLTLTDLKMLFDIK
ncbi:PREDICTED: transcription termination factor 2-like [Priapulus caudatus]|uniref:Transcription termination factor 2-like n=1 Tax=Priapulus caudatus TaxID=37621 RepID=A0ABM1E6I9_PRICU|nr:PREDICTED: transcription termination factor 2-like [Priapulus caudatus]